MSDLIIDAVGEIAESGNYFVVIRDSTMYLVNRNQDAADIIRRYDRPELVSLEVVQAHPIRRLSATFEQNVPYAHSRRLETQQQSVHLNVNEFGSDVEVSPLSQVDDEIKSFLVNYYNIQKRPVVTATVVDIIRHEIGDRIVCFDDYLELKAEITINTIRYNFEEATTEFSGYSVVSHVKAT